jgi:hypothetical protein
METGGGFHIIIILTLGKTQADLDMVREKVCWPRLQTSSSFSLTSPISFWVMNGEYIVEIYLILENQII